MAWSPAIPTRARRWLHRLRLPSPAGERPPLKISPPAMSSCSAVCTPIFAVRGWWATWSSSRCICSRIWSPQPAAGVNLAQPAGTRLDVTVQPRRGYQVEGPARGEVVLGSPNEFDPLYFELRATEAGEGDVRVIVSLAGTIVGYMKLTGRVLSTAGEVSYGEREEVSHTQTLTAVRVDDPDLLLHIEEVQQAGQRGFVITLSAEDPALNLNLKRFGPFFFKATPAPTSRGSTGGSRACPTARPTTRPSPPASLKRTVSTCSKASSPASCRSCSGRCRTASARCSSNPASPGCPGSCAA